MRKSTVYKMRFNGSELFRDHCKRMSNIRPVVDTKGVIIRTDGILDIGKLKEDGCKYMSVTKRNMLLFRAINRILRTRGRVETTDNGHLAQFVDKSKFVRKARHRAIKIIDQENLIMAQRILGTKCVVQTHPSKFAHKSRMIPPHKTFELPTFILAKYKRLILPRTKLLQYKMLRPRVFIGLGVKDLRALGFIEIQFYTEASPQVVCELVSICAAKDINRLSLLRIFPGLWLEGKLKLSTKLRSAKKLEYDMRALDHSLSAGILSYSLDCLNGFTEDYMHFTFSFKPLTVLNGHRVAFGRVLRGKNLLDALQDYGSKNGKCKREIVITHCGMYH